MNKEQPELKTGWWFRLYRAVLSSEKPLHSENYGLGHHLATEERLVDGLGSFTEELRQAFLANMADRELPDTTFAISEGAGHHQVLLTRRYSDTVFHALVSVRPIGIDL